MSVSTTEKFWRVVAITISVFALLSTAFVVNNHFNREVPKRPKAGFSGRTLMVSEQSRGELVAFMQREPTIIAISAVSISLVANQRQVTFFESKNPEMKDSWEHYMATRETVPTVFTDDKKYNTRITSIINGNFECRATKDTVTASLFHAEKYAPTLCSVSVPASFDSSGDFVGYINLYLSQPVVTDSEKSRLAKEVVFLSTTIYNRDLSND